MEEIIEELFTLLDCIAMSGAMTKQEEEILARIEKDYKLVIESECLISCPNCGHMIKV